MIVHAADEAIVTIVNTTNNTGDVYLKRWTNSGDMQYAVVDSYVVPGRVDTLAECAVKTIHAAVLAKTGMSVAVRARDGDFVVYLTVNDNNGKPTPVVFSMSDIEDDTVCKLAAAILTKDHKVIFDLYVTQMANDMASGREIR